MLFNSSVFLFLFLPLSLFGYHFVFSERRAKMYFLIVTSLIFYGFWDYRFLFLLLFSVVFNWLVVYFFFCRKLKFLIAFSLVVNLLLIGFFKYFNFFAGALGGIFGYQYEGFNIILPLGISFFTFQQISYLIDAKRGDVGLYSFLDYALHILFFPHLIAGPIVRHSDIVDQFARIDQDKELAKKFVLGVVYFVIGLASKVILADSLSEISDSVFGGFSDGGVSFSGAWVAAISFGFQVYFDFAGYSTMAIGLALMFGFYFPQNFNSPYKSLSIRDFWRRWHITLSNLIRDYLYIPLGGRQKIHAVLISMALCGLWHGAAFGYIIWGFLHGVGIVVNNFFRRFDFVLPRICSWLLTYLYVTFCWVFFRSIDLKSSWDIAVAMISFEFREVSLSAFQIAVLVISALVAFFGVKACDIVDFFERSPSIRNSFVAFLLALILVFLILYLEDNDYKQFVYFIF